MVSELDHYETLQVSPRAEPEVIEAAYRRLARKYHPDLNPHVAALDRMRELNRAFDILIDPRKRAEYDRRRLRELAKKALAEKPDVRFFATPPREDGYPQWLERPWRRPISWALIFGGTAAALVAVAFILLQISPDLGGDPSTEEDVLSASSTPAPAAAGIDVSPSPSASPPAQGSGTFSNGTWLVGEEIAPGMWRAVRARACSWKRLSSIEGAADTVAGSGSQLTLEIAPTDAAFWSDGCGWWTQILTPPSSAPEDPFGPGTWLVNREIAPGLWQNSDASEGCSWSRLSSLDGGPTAVSATGFGHSIITIQLTETDRAFDSTGCGTWTRVAD